MKRLAKKIIGTIVLVMTMCFSLGTVAFASSDYPEAFDFGDMVVSMNAGSTHDMSLYAKYNYVYFVGDHTSKDTFIECSRQKGYETIRLHIGADEQVRNVFFYFYVDEDPYKNGDLYGTIEVYVQNIRPEFTDPTVLALKSYQGNSSEFNAFYYYVNYPDLQVLIGKNGDALITHYITNGIAEHRVANKLK